VEVVISTGLSRMSGVRGDTDSRATTEMALTQAMDSDSIQRNSDNTAAVAAVAAAAVAATAADRTAESRPQRAVG
jgi:hypothetical protein